VTSTSRSVHALRYFLLRHVGPRQDADIDEPRLEAVYRSELADQLGNLLCRTVTLLQRHADGRLPPAPEGGVDESGEQLAALSRHLPSEVDQAIARLVPDDGLRAIWRVVNAANKHLADTAPWTLARDPRSRPRVLAILHHATCALSAIGGELVPFLPRTAEAILRALARPADGSPILFPKNH
jgi:methionyl-tRNA synthetase